MSTSTFGCPSTCEKGPRCQDHIVILINTINEMRQRSWTTLKNVAAKFDKLQIEAKCVPKVHKPIFVKLANSTVCKILMIKAWGLTSTNVSILEKDDDLVVLITNSKMAYAKEVCVAWDLKCEKHGPSKVRHKKEIQTIVSYHES